MFIIIPFSKFNVPKEKVKNYHLGDDNTVMSMNHEK